MRSAEIENKKVLVLGLGVSGRSAAEFLVKQKVTVTALDDDAVRLKSDQTVQKLRGEGLHVESEESRIPWEGIDLVVASPGFPPSHRAMRTAKQRGIEVIGEIELACRYLTTPVVGITGTNGKTTTALFTTHVLNSAGHPAKAVGNVGTPLTSVALQHAVPTLVLELSSYQLETMHTPVLTAGAILNITPNHLDRYNSFQDYAKAKCHMQNCLREGGVLFVEEKAAAEFAADLRYAGLRTFGYAPHNYLFTDGVQILVDKQPECQLPKALQGAPSHHLDNFMAAYVLCRQLGVAPLEIAKAWETFQRPPHRIEFVRELEGVSFFDDSKGSNVVAVICAVQSLPGQGEIVLIAGGVDKGSSYLPWVEGFRGRVRHICAIGAASKKIKAELGEHFSVELYGSLQEAVEQAYALAKPGDTVLLSPGCSSYDMFKDYIHRGMEFKRIVNELPRA